MKGIVVGGPIIWLFSLKSIRNISLPLYVP